MKSLVNSHLFSSQTPEFSLKEFSKLRAKIRIYPDETLSNPETKTVLTTLVWNSLVQRELQVVEPQTTLKKVLSDLRQKLTFQGN